ncbi:MAG: toll/interleukin-1 receptor domain-containing protein [Anaerolineae bacterium]|nr:toll/interleukin-1 receptor domain-containing protein [Anaerolineae bacterium]
MSYARANQKFASQLRDWLDGAGYNVWLDITDISAGLWEAQVRQNVMQSDAVLVILTPEAVESKQVRREWEMARNLNKIVLPILLQDCTIPDELTAYQWVDFRAAEGEQEWALNISRGLQLIKYLNDTRHNAGVYINYREGAKDETLVARLREDLKAAGISVWSDLDDVAEQTYWGEAAQRGLNDARVMLLVVSPSSMFSRRVDAQLRYFLRELKKPVIPLLVDEQARVGSELIDLHYVDFTFELEDSERYEQAVVQLLAELRNQGLFLKLTDPALATQVDAIAQHNLPIFSKRFQRRYDGPLALFKPPVLQSYTNYTKVELLISRVRRGLWISGIAMSKTSEHIGLFKRLVESAIRAAEEAGDPPPEACLRFLLLDPRQDDALLEAGRFLGRMDATTTPDSLEFARFQRRILSSLDNLAEIQAAYPHEVGLRVTSIRPAVGYFIADPDAPDGFMTAHPYMVHIDARPVDQQAPFLHLTRQAEPKWFDIFRADFLQLWETSEEWQPG